jgi:hypothetical protein
MNKILSVASKASQNETPSLSSLSKLGDGQRASALSSNIY